MATMRSRPLVTPNLDEFLADDLLFAASSSLFWKRRAARIKSQSQREGCRKLLSKYSNRTPEINVSQNLDEVARRNHHGNRLQLRASAVSEDERKAIDGSMEARIAVSMPPSAFRSRSIRGCPNPAPDQVEKRCDQEQQQVPFDLDVKRK
jgi:hypothetical protein